MNEIRHVGIVVESIDSSRTIWLDVLGFNVISDEIESGPEIDGLLGIKGTVVRSLKMSTAQKNSAVELLEFHFPKDKESQGVQLVYALGIRHIALTVKHLDRLLNELEDHGIFKVGEITTSKSGKTKGIYVSTKDGLFLELVEELE